jgi:hypothetical protein
MFDFIKNIFVLGMVLIAVGTLSAGMNSALNSMTEGLINKQFGDLNYNHLEYIFIIILCLAGVGILVTFAANPKKAINPSVDDIASDRAVSMISIGWTDMSCRNLREGDAASQINVETKFEHDRERTVSMILEPSPIQNEDRVTD